MMKRLHLLILILLLPLFCISQPKIDSLHAMLERYPTPDSFRVKLLNQIGFEYWVVDAAKAQYFGEQSLDIAVKLDYIAGQAMAHRVIGVSHWSRGNFYEALSHLFQSQSQYQQLKDSLGEANATLNIGLVYGDQSYYDQALTYYFKALNIFAALERDDRAATAYTKIGTVYIEQKKYQEAYEYLNKAMVIHAKNNFEFGILEVSNRLGILYTAKEQAAEARHYLNKSLLLAEKRNDLEHVVKNLENLGRLSMAEGKLQEAEQYLLTAYPLAERHGYKKWFRDIAHDLKNLYSQKGDFSKALFYFEKYHVVRDSIFNEDKAMHIANLQLERETREKEQNLKLHQREIELLQAQSKSDTLIKYLLLLSVIAVTSVGYALFRNQRLRSRRKEDLLQSRQQLYRSRQALAEAELENAKLKEKELYRELEFKNKELTSYTMNFIHKNELFDDLRNKLEEIKKKVTPELAKEVNGLLRLAQGGQNIDKDWEDFKVTFENVHRHFFSRLLRHSPDLSNTELKLCALIQLNLSIKEIASMLGISPDSVKTSRYRLRKKLGLNQEQSLADFIMNLTTDPVHS